MTKAIDPAIEQLQEVFEIIDGKIWRKEYTVRGRKYGGCFVEIVANHSDGYCDVWFKGRGVRYHRILWVLVNGLIPAGYVVDHKDGNKINNDIDNLRLLTVRENAQNQHYHRTGKLCGVYWSKRLGKWRAHIHVDGKQIHLGCFNTELEAFDAYIQANKDYGYPVTILEEHRQKYLEKTPNKAVAERKEGVAI